MEFLFAFCFTLFIVFLFVLPILLVVVVLAALWTLIKSNRNDVSNDLQ
jgi:hypothetical protein